MRRQLVAPVLACCSRGAASLANLLKAQELLRSGQRLPAPVASDFAAFFNVPVARGKGPEVAAREYHAAVGRQGAEAEKGAAVREQSLEYRGRADDLPVFLLGHGAAGDTVMLYSVAADRVVMERAEGGGGDAWDLADTLLTRTGGAKQFLVIPVVDSPKERLRVHTAVAAFAVAVKGSGLLPTCHVDSIELAETLDRSPPSLLEVVGPETAKTLPPLSEKWFRAHWVLLRTLACKAADADPMRTISTYILPRFDVYVMHLVRAGSRSMNLSLWDPVRRRRFVAKGMLSDVLACLFSTQSTQFTLIPTNRTDRAILFRCRAALLKAGHRCVLVFASEMDERYRRVFQSDPSQYWRQLGVTSGSLDADVHAQVCIAAGATLRTYHRRMLLEGKNRAMLDARRDRMAAANDGDENADIAPMTEVERWLAPFQLPARRASEEAETAHYGAYLAVAVTSTEHLLFGQPRNPGAAGNYVVSAAFADGATGAVLEPLAKYTARGQFALPCLDGYSVLVVHDAKHLLLLLGCGDSAELAAFLRRGGRVWCTMLAEYLLDAQRLRTGSNSLSEVALRYGCLLPPAGRVGSGPEDLPLAFHRRHLLPAAQAVATVFTGQLRRAVSQRQLVSLAHRMDSLLAMASMEWAGIRVDRAEAERQSRALANAAAVLDKALVAFVPPEVPLDLRSSFDWMSLPQLHAYFFGGDITLGGGGQARASRQWTSNLVHLCHHAGVLPQLAGELHLMRFATENGVVNAPAGGARLPQRVAAHIEEEGSHKRKKYRLVVFDIESTGLNATTDEIIEIGMFDPAENTTFTSLVKPRRPISPRTIAIHHITDDAVKGAPGIAAVVAGIVDFLRLDAARRDPDEATLLLGHNVFGLDEPMLRRALVANAPEVSTDGLLFCDSVVLLRALKVQLQDSRLHSKHVDPRLLEALTSSLRLGKLIEKLRVTPEGQLHRADTDAKALWFVLVNAFGLGGQKPARQREALLAEVARTLLLYPAAGCFVPSERKAATQAVRLPGVAMELLPRSAKLVSSLEARPFGDRVLESLHSHGVKVAGLLLQRANLDRHASRFLQAGGGGPLSVLHPDGAVRQHIDMTSTTTSRTTSAYPSLQNIPKDDKSSVRRLFVSRFGAQGRCVEIDYSQLEIVVLAILCRDPNLVRDLSGGVDFHVKRAEFFSGLPYREIYEGYKRDIPKYVKLRKTAKQFSFQRLYGAGVPLLHKTTGIPYRDLEASIRLEDKAYPGISHFHRIARSVALRPNNPGLPTDFIVEMPTGLRMSFRTRDIILNLPPLKNYPIQGYGAEIAQSMLGRVFRRFVETDFYGGRAFMTNFVHDSVWLDCHVDVLEECAGDTVRILGSVHEYLPARFPGLDISVPLTLSSSCGLDMASMASVDRSFAGVKNQKKTKPVKFTAADLLPSPSVVAASLAAARVMDEQDEEDVELPDDGSEASAGTDVGDQDGSGPVADDEVEEKVTGDQGDEDGEDDVPFDEGEIFDI